MTPRRHLPAPARASLPGAAALLVLLGLVATAPAARADIAIPAQPVTDRAGVLSAEVVEALAGRVEEVREATGAQIAVLVERSIGDQPIEDVAQRLFDAWNLGRAGVDDGVLLLLAVQERRVRIHVGYGLEGNLTDGEAATITGEMVPYLRAEDYDGGVTYAVEGIIAQVGPGVGEPLRTGDYPSAAPPPGEPRSGCRDPAGFAFFLFIIVIFVLGFLSKNNDPGGGWTYSSSGRGGGGWGSSSGGFPSAPRTRTTHRPSSSRGGGWGGGGGRSGGGGASGSW